MPRFDSGGWKFGELKEWWRQMALNIVMMGSSAVVAAVASMI